MNRQRRVNAGVNKRYDEQTYCLVSFPDPSKHALVPSRVINIDPIDDRAATIKVRGIRRGVEIVGSGAYISLPVQLIVPIFETAPFRIQRRNETQGVQLQLTGM